ncbi:MAG: M50 family metallopeptidase [Patescibacteria group bacterium]|nr:M50 family metallopeptidase [Patescibacteria group bacterium]
MKSKHLIYILFSMPGIIVHEFSHQLFCSLSGVKVFKVKYFQLKNPAGFVEHAQPRNFIQAFFISVGPFIFGTIISLLLFWFAIHTTTIRPLLPTTYYLLLIFSFWFGTAIALHCFPSSGDAKVLLLETNRHVLHRFNPFALILYPFVFIIKLANFLKRFYFDWIYAIILL